jgi:hypothetical protein
LHVRSVTVRRRTSGEGEGGGDELSMFVRVSH